jgi:CcmD family protein
MKSYAFLFWAYNVVWAGLVLYVLFVAGRLSRASRRLDQLERRIEKAPASHRGDERNAGALP